MAGEAKVTVALDSTGFSEDLKAVKEQWDSLPEDAKEAIRKNMEGPKDGLRTTEFWLCAVVVVINMVLASGALVEMPEAVKILNLIIAGLAAVGYTGSRALVKR